MTMFRFPLMKQVFSGMFSKKEKKSNRKERHLVMDALESRELLTVTAASTTSFYVNELPIYETSSNIIEQIQNLRDNNLSIDYDLGGDEDGDLVVVWERPDTVYTVKSGEQYKPVIDNTTLSPSLDWNIYARYLTNETQRLYLDYTKFNTGTYSSIGLFYGQMQDLNGNFGDSSVDTKVASGLVYKISFSSQAEPLQKDQDSINARFSIYAYDSTGQSTVSTFTFNEEYAKTLSIDAETEDDVLNYTNSMETNAAELQAKLRGLGQTQGKYLNDCVVKAISPTEFYVYVYSEDIKATWDDTTNTWKWIDVNSKDSSIPHLAIYQENPEGNEASGFEVSADISIVSAPCMYNNIKIDPSRPLDSADNIQKAFDSKKSTNLMAPIFMPAPDRINAQRNQVLEGPATESDMLVSGNAYPEVLVVPVYGLTDELGNSLDGFVYDITFVGSSSYINHPLLTALASDGSSSLSEDPILRVETIKESSPEFRVNSLEESDPADSDDPFKEVEYFNQLNPAVAMDADGDFVITWQSEVSNSLVRGSYTDIFAKTYSARNYINDYSSEWPSDMMVNTVDTYTYIEVDPDNLEENYYQKNSKNVYIQSVVETSDEFRVNTSTANAQRNPDVAMDLDGNFVIVWDSEGQTISYFNGVYMQRYDKDGKAVSAETRVDTDRTGASTNPSVAADDEGKFVVTWEYTNNPLIDIQFPYYTFYNHYFSYYYETDFYYMSEIHASVYNTIYPSKTEFRLVQPEFVVGATDVNGGKDPQAAFSDTGDMVINWTGLETDTDSTGEISSGVYAEQYKVKTISVYSEVSAATYFDREGITDEEALILAYDEFSAGSNGIDYENYKVRWQKYNGNVLDWLQNEPGVSDHVSRIIVPEPDDPYMQALLDNRSTITDGDLRATYEWWRDQARKYKDQSLTCEYYLKTGETTTVTKVRDVYRVNSATLNIEDNPTYWDYSQLVGNVGLDADGDLIFTYAGYGPDVSVNSIIPYVQGASLSTTSSWSVFLSNMKSLLTTQSGILSTKYGDEKFADLTNFFNPNGRTVRKGAQEAGDYFGTINLHTTDVNQDGTLVTFTSNNMLRLLSNLDNLPDIPEEVTPEFKAYFELRFEQIFGYSIDFDDFDIDLDLIKRRDDTQANQYLTGIYQCHGDVNSVIATVLTNAQLLFKYDPAYAQLRQNEVEFQNVKNVVLGALASVLESQFGLLRGESSGVMFTQLDAAIDAPSNDSSSDDFITNTDNGNNTLTGTGNITSVGTTLEVSAFNHSDSVVNDKRDGVTAVADIALDVNFNRIWDNISITINNKGNLQTEAVSVDLFDAGAYDYIGNGLYQMNPGIAAEAIEAALSAQTNLVGTSWRDETNKELELYEGPVEVRVVNWNELEARGLMHIGDETSRYSNASMDINMYRSWYNENRNAIRDELGINRFEDFTFEDLLEFVYNDELEEDEQQERINNLPVIFEIVFQGSVHDLELSVAWENATVRIAEQQVLTLSPNRAGALWYAIRVDGAPDEFTNPTQLLTFDCTNEGTVMASLDALRGYMETLGYESVSVELIDGPRDDDGEYKWGPVGQDDTPYQIRITFAGSVGQNISLQYYNTFVLPPLTDEGGYDPANYPWLNSGRFATIQDGGTMNRAPFGVSMYYYGDLGTPQTDATINVTPEGSFQIGYLQHELYSSRIMSNQDTNSTYDSYSNTNVLVRAFNEKTDTAGPKISGISIDGKRVQQNDEINNPDINYVVVYFNEEMMYYNFETKYSNSESADWDNSVINPENWQLTKDGTAVLGAIDKIYYGMNMSQYLLIDNSGYLIAEYEEYGDGKLRSPDGNIYSRNDNGDWVDDDGNEVFHAVSDYGSNKWEAVIFFDSPLVNGTYDLVANKRIEDVKGNRLNRNGEQPDGKDTTYSFHVTTYEAEGPYKGEGSDKNYFEQTLEGSSEYRWSPNAVGINDDGDTVTVWISEDESGHENIYYQIEYAVYDAKSGNYVVDPNQTVKLALFDENGVVKNLDGKNSFNHGIQHAAVAMAEDGDFIISWSEYNLDSSNGKVSWDVYARRYNLDGTPKDDLPTYLSYEAGVNNHEDLRVNTTTLGDQMYSSVAISSLGNYAITWMSLEYQDEREKVNADWDIYAAQYYADGSRKVDEVATQEILFTSAVYEGSFQIQYTTNQSKYLEDENDVRTTSMITITPPETDEIYGKIEFNGAVYENTPDNMAQVIKKALREINIDATIEATSYDFFTVKFNAVDGSPVPDNLGELAILPGDLLVSSEGKAVNTTVRTKYAADTGEILVNESYMLTPGACEVQRFSFGTGQYFANLISLYFEFDYTDFEGVVHHCKTTEPAYMRPGLAGYDAEDTEYHNDERYWDPDYHLFDYDFLPETEEFYHRIHSIIGALRTFEDQYGNAISIENNEDESSLDFDVFIRGVDDDKNTITVYFSNDTLGYDISPLRATNVQIEDKQLSPNTNSKELVKGTMGGIFADPTEIEISNNPDNYYDLKTKHQMYPDIAMDAAGNFVVTWTSYGDEKYRDSSTESNIYARRFDTDGDTICVGLVNTGYVNGTQKWSSVDMDRKGDFVISWTSDSEDNIEVYAKRYTFLQAYYNGDAEASELDPNKEDENAYYTEAYAFNDYGYLLDYKGRPIFFHSLQVGDYVSVVDYANIDYKAVNDAFIVNTTQLGKQEYSKVSMDANGNFIITWESDDATMNIADKSYTINAQKYISNSNLKKDEIGKDGNEMTLSHIPSSDRHSDRFPTVAMNSDGDWIVAWTCFPERDDTQSEIWHVVNREKPYDDHTSPVITKFQAVSPLEQGDLFTYVYDNNGNIVRDENNSPVFTWTDKEQRYSVNENNEINTVDINGNITSKQPLNNPENPTYVYDNKNDDDKTNDTLVIYEPGNVQTVKDVTISDELPYSDFTANGLLNYIFTNDADTGNKEYAYTDTKDSYLDIDNGKIYNSEYKTQDIDYLISEDYSLDENGEQVVALIVGFSEEMSHTGATSVLNPSNWNIYRTDIEGNKVLVPIQGIVDREDSMFSNGDDKKNEIVIYIQPGEDGLPALPSGYTYEFIGSTDMEDMNKNPLDGSYSQWDFNKTNGKVGGTESSDFDMSVDVGIPTSLDSGNVSEEPEEFTASDLLGDTLVNYFNQEGIQENSAVAMDQYGNYVVVWETDWIREDKESDYQKDPELNRFLYDNGKLVAYSKKDQSNGFRRIMAQMYDYDGNKVGQEFVIMLEEYTHQSQPDVAMDKFGNVVVTWVELTDSIDSHFEDSSRGDREMMTLDPYEDGTNIFAVRFKVAYDDDYYVTDMSQYGDVFQVDTDVKGVKTNPKVAIDSSTGNFVVTWANEDYSTYPEAVLREDNNYPDGVVDRCGIYARIYSFTTTDNQPHAIASMRDSNGAYSNKPFLVNVADNLSQTNPSVAMENGNLMVVWQASTTKSTIQGRTYQLDAGGKVIEVNNQIVINEYGQYSKATPSVDMDSLGNAVVAYSSNLHDGSEKGIYARTFKVDRDGKLTLNGLNQPEFRVNSETYDDQFEPVVGLGDDGHCVISWVSFGHEVSDYDASATSRYSYGVFAKWYDDVFDNAENRKDAKDVQINSLIYGSQFQQDISVNNKGECVFTWTGPGNLGRNYPSGVGNNDGTSGGNNGGNDDGVGTTDTGTNKNGGTAYNITNTYDNLVNGNDLAGVSDHVSVLDYSDIYRRRFLWTSSSPSTLSPDYVNDEGTGSVKQNKEIDKDVDKTVIFSVADGTWTMVQGDEDPQQISSKILDVDGNGSEVTLYGSAGADNVKFMTVKDDNGNNVDAVELSNSLGQKITLYNFSKVNVIGRGGSDSVVFENTGDEARKFASVGSSATLSTSKYAYSVVDFANIDFRGASGDEVSISGTNSKDTVTLDEDSVTATGLNNSYNVTADGFDSLKLNFNVTSEEKADDLMVNAKNIVSFQAGSEGGSLETTDYTCEFNGFKTVAATAKFGSTSLSGLPDASIDVTEEDSTLYMYSDKVILTENNNTVIVYNFGNVTANIAPEAADCTVRIYDSNGNDSYLFDAASKTATMSLANGYKLTAIGTTAAEAYSKFGGTDSATFNDSAAADTVQTVARVMRMTDGDITDPTAPNTYYVTANGFAVNNAYSSDKLDTVLFVDETVVQTETTAYDVKDDFTVTCLDNKVMAFMQSSAKTTYSNTAWGFTNIFATARSISSVDTARVSDGQGDLSAKTFVVTPDSIEMVLENDTTVNVFGFRNKVVESTESTITLNDGYSADTLVMQENVASMSGEYTLFGGKSYDYSISATAPTLIATSVYGGTDANGKTDKATFICVADKSEFIDITHVGESVTVNVKEANNAYNSTINNFKTTTVNKADNNDSAKVKITNSATDMPITVTSNFNEFYYSQNGSYSREVKVSGALKSLVFSTESAGRISPVNVSLHDSALADELDVSTSLQMAVIEQVASHQTRSFAVANGDVITVSSNDSTKNQKFVDGVLTDWDDWSDTDSWLKGE